MRIPHLVKKPEEIFSVGLKYISPDLDEGQYISGGTVTIEPDEAGGLKKEGNIVIEADIVSQLISGGIDGKEYFLDFIVTTSGGHTYKDTIFIKIRSR